MKPFQPRVPDVCIQNDFARIEKLTIKVLCINLIKIWSRINVTSELNFCKIMRKTELRSRSISCLLQYHVIFHLYWFN